MFWNHFYFSQCLEAAVKYLFRLLEVSQNLYSFYNTLLVATCLWGFPKPSGIQGRPLWRNKRRQRNCWVFPGRMIFLPTVDWRNIENSINAWSSNVLGSGCICHLMALLHQVIHLQVSFSFLQKQNLKLGAYKRFFSPGEGIHIEGEMAFALVTVFNGQEI